jgi:putative mRNA 3-end processing factor
MVLTRTEHGLYCEAGDFYVDPWQPVDVAVITHGHSDHARFGCRTYLTELSGKPILQERLGVGTRVEGLPYGQNISRNGVNVSLHPAGHILGSAQVRIEHRGQVWVVSGDYKLERDPTCQPFELVRCQTFVTESTFGLPIYHWRPSSEVFGDIEAWWRENQARKRTSVIFCYALGKAQRLLSGLDGRVGPIFLHGAIERFLPLYRAAGVVFPPTTQLDPESVRGAAGRSLVLAPVSANHSPWLRRFGELSTAFASGWMQVRGTRRRRSIDRGFVLSDHADWDGLLATIDLTGAEMIWATHGHASPLARWLREQGKTAQAIETRFEGELADEIPPPPAVEQSA